MSPFVSLWLHLYGFITPDCRRPSSCHLELSSNASLASPAWGSRSICDFYIYSHSWEAQTSKGSYFRLPESNVRTGRIDFHGGSAASKRCLPRRPLAIRSHAQSTFSTIGQVEQAETVCLLFPLHHKLILIEFLLVRLKSHSKISLKILKPVRGVVGHPIFSSSTASLPISTTCSRQRYFLIPLEL